MKKSATGPQTRSPTNIYPPDHMAAWPMDKSGAAGAANDNNLAELVWKHFREEITQALQETQQVRIPGRSGSTPRARQQKR
jgi:hypothetical protein